MSRSSGWNQEAVPEKVVPEGGSADARGLLRLALGRSKGKEMTQGRHENRVRVGPWMAFKMFFKGYISPTDQLRYKHMLADYDDPADEPTDGLVDVETTEGERVKKPRHSNVNWWATYSLLAHSKHHSPTYTRANEIIVSSWIQKRMEADKVRATVIAKVLPLAVRMAFVPTDADIDAQKIDNAPGVRRRYKKRNTKYWSSFFGLRSGHYESGQ